MSWASSQNTSQADAEKYLFAAAKKNLGDKLMTLDDSILYDKLVTLKMELIARSGRADVGVDINTSAADSESLYNFWNEGKKVFRVSKGLTALLQETPLKVAAKFLKLPFRSIMFDMEESGLFVGCNDDHTIYPVKAIYVYEQDNWRDPDAPLNLGNMNDVASVKRELAARKEVAVAEKGYCHFTYKFVAFAHPGSGWDLKVPGNMYFGHFPRTLEDNVMIDSTYLKKQVQVGSSHPFHTMQKRFDQRPDGVVQDLMATDDKLKLVYPVLYVAIWEDIFKLLAYINSTNTDVKKEESPQGLKQAEIARKEGKKVVPKRIYRKAQGLSSLPYFSVGSTINLPSQSTQTTEKVGGLGFRYRYRFQVRGHYQHFWVKKENLAPEAPERKEEGKDGKVMVLKWVRPYWKGPDTAQVLRQEYDVKEEK